MFKSIVRAIKSIFASQPEKNHLEEYIINNNPQSVLDVEYLERQFLKRRDTPLISSYNRY